MPRRRVVLEGAEWDADQLPAPNTDAPPSLTGVVFTRVSEHFEVSEAVEAETLDSASEGALRAGLRKALKSNTT
jgi:hypothetical protein